MAKAKQGDTLLAISGIGLRIYIAAAALGVVGVTAATVVLVAHPPSDIAGELAAAPPAALPVIVAGAAMFCVTLVLGILFALQLGRIISTVKDGDPFEPANADRLTRMAWYALGATVASWLIQGMAGWLTQQFEALQLHVAPMGGLALVITLFILARVFRHGAAMRDDLIGTV